MACSFWDPSKGLHGMFDLWSFSEIDSVVSAGLGGGSDLRQRDDPQG
jgi:cholesterol oxidase